MKNLIGRLLGLALLIAVSACQQKSHEHEHHDADAEDAVEVSGNQELYNEVMKVHDEVMPKMNDLHKLKMSLKDKLDKGATLTPAEKAELQAIVTRLDSAGESMMTWMHEFNPLPDSLGEEKAREYLEQEMEKIKKVKASIENTLNEAAKK